MFLLAIEIFLVFVIVALLIEIGTMAGMEEPRRVHDRLIAYWSKCRKSLCTR